MLFSFEKHSATYFILSNIFPVFNIFREVLCLEFLYCRVLTGSADGKVR